MSGAQQAVSLFLPVYNEADNLPSVVAGCHTALNETGRAFEIVIVDDGSTDGTAEIIDTLEHRFPAVRSVHHEENQGYGRALATGFTAAEHPIIGYLDGDGQFDPGQIDAFLQHIDDYDLVVGYREHREDAWRRRVAGDVFNRLARLLLPVTVQDVDCGFKMVRRRMVENLELETVRTVDAELLAKAAATGYSIKEVPVTHRKREEGLSEAAGVFGVRLPLVLKSIEELFMIRRMIR